MEYCKTILSHTHALMTKGGADQPVITKALPVLSQVNGTQLTKAFLYAIEGDFQPQYIIDAGLQSSETGGEQFGLMKQQGIMGL